MEVNKMRIDPDNKKIRYSEGLTGQIQKNRFGFIRVHQQNLNLQEER